MEEGTADGTQHPRWRMGWLGTRVTGGDDIYRFTCGSYTRLDLIVEEEGRLKYGASFFLSLRTRRGGNRVRGKNIFLYGKPTKIT